MRASRTKELRRGLAGGLRASILAWAVLAGARPVAAQIPIGVECTTGPDFTLFTGTGSIFLPDGDTAFMWGFSTTGDFQHPGPVLCVTEGETVNVVLHNTLLEDVSLVFPGQEGVLADGVPAQPQFDAGGKLVSLANVAPRNGGTVTYTFVASRPGTFLYESGTEPQKQVRMGLFGALVVRPATTGGGSRAYGHAGSEYTPEEEFMVLLSEIDPFQHQAAARSTPTRTVNFDLGRYQPRYWLLNGRGFPDTIADNHASWLPTQPYGALARIHPFDATRHPLPGLIRYLNVGTESFPFHPHGNNGLVIGRDGHPLLGAGGEDLSFEKFAINIGPGQTWDVTFRWYDAEGYGPANFPIDPLPSLVNVQLGMFYSGSPFLGSQEPLPPGMSTLNLCGEYYIISHNHALYQITSWGVNMTGPITYVRVDPPLPNACPP